MAWTKSVALCLASGLCLGLLPGIPGTFGALVGLAIQLVALHVFASYTAFLLTMAVSALLIAWLHYALTPWAQRYWAEPDPSHFVLDEIVGTLCVPLFSFFILDGWWCMAGFALFRVLDAIKLPGAAYIDRNIHSASGVLFDDIVSAAYSGITLTIVHALTH